MPKSAQVSSEEVVALRDAKTNLSALTKQAKDGVRVVITNHGTPIADLVQHGAGTVPLRYLKRPGPPPKLIKLTGRGSTASDLVLLDREG